ncbi:DeoR/GlpR family DNA-binding transcription regulator [Lactobacillus crispatus]|uniref:DeoR/GlpR transcriptional regulator n=2 Tax=Lactobacillus crispatus TaxID=47770 RepID=A0AB73BMN4_9LACO|nr:DeoR/GlpR family DNA-binding transcription regulator [Lactobacillus crispatus]HJF23175.1 DeoR/GlpR family DNA-binding transcription regulator [Mammaliicoccus lentus]KAA8781919.1 DeoR/GlpR transcriptional regulator [Lactobacillus crispatus]KAA8791849.1 DeoR/GlpR transcriptional regulator [Lactobacillus crispatus]KAA8796411.1 DeoR/GlpR transcriptional regulator [Lactobacillus crispatus]KAA8797585.1 DeoR/GlpR transcriptional regulator [Lactobacillus crispatus]
MNIQFNIYATIKRTMLINSNIVLVLIDHTKFNNNDFVKLCDLNYLDYVITDCPISDDTILQALKKNRVNIIYKKLGGTYRTK